MTENKQSLSVSAEGGVINVEAEYNSSLPHPSIVQQYENLIPGAAREILDMAKIQLVHRHGLEIAEQRHIQISFDKTLKLQFLGQVCAFIVVLSVIFAGVYLIVTGHSTEGLAALLVPLLGVAGVVLFKKSQ